MTFDEYWSDPRFRNKRPNLAGSKKRAFGDNIYHHVSGRWVQEDSHHSLKDGSCDFGNLQNDTQTDRVLIADWYVYFGGNGSTIPPRFRNFEGRDLYAGRGHKNNEFPPAMVTAVIEWITSLGDEGYAGKPLDWARTE